MRSGAVPAAERIMSRPLDWIMLDCYARRPSCGGDDPGNSTWAYGLTSTGDRVGVGLSAAAPPGTSHLLLDSRPDNTAEEERRRRPNECSAAQAVAAHRSSILLFLVLPNEVTDFFVYQARPAVTTTLKRLPPCGHKPYAVRETVGILCPDGEDEFAVAHLTVAHHYTPVNGGLSVRAELCRMLSREGPRSSWRTTQNLPIRFTGEERWEDLIWWETDAVVPFGDSTLCWVDYLRGVLFCDDALSPNNPADLRYVPLPVEPLHWEASDRRRTLPLYRSLCVTDDGASVKFVDVAPWNAWFGGTPDYSRRIPAITSWTLSGGDRSTWVEDGRVDVADFFAISRRLDLPCVLPTFPLVDIKDPRTVYVVLTEGFVPAADGSNACVVAVNMSRKTIAVSTSGSPCTAHNLSNYEPFLPCEFSKYLGLTTVIAADDSCTMAPAGNVTIKFGSLCFDEICSKEEQAVLAAGHGSKMIFRGVPARLKEEEKKKKPSTIQIGTMAVITDMSSGQL